MSIVLLGSLKRTTTTTTDQCGPRKREERKKKARGKEGNRNLKDALGFAENNAIII